MFILTDTQTGSSAPGSFLFSLRDKDNLAPFKAPLENQNHVNAIKLYSGFGPTFGVGFDLHIYINAGSSEGSYASLGHAYQAPAGYTKDTLKTQTLLAGGSAKQFTPSEVEVLYFNE